MNNRLIFISTLLIMALGGCATQEKNLDAIAQNETKNKQESSEKRCRPQSIGSRVRTKCDR